MKKLLATLLCYLGACALSASAQPLAFPGAEGAGRFAAGGRGGDVYHVTNLNDSGPGSFREGCETAKGPRTIVFDVSGNIAIKRKLDVHTSFLTIAGQTAPGGGITFRDGTFSMTDAHDIIIRFVRFRYGDKNKVDGTDPMDLEGITNSIIDHCSISWGVDGEQDQRHCKDFTMQWMIVAEALRYSIHPERHEPRNSGKLFDHARAMSFRDVLGDETIHHNIIASCGDRFPTLGGGAGTHPDSVTNFSNNLMYNQVGATNLGKNISVVENNYYRPGPDSNYDKKKPISVKAEPVEDARGWVAGNYFEGRPGYTKDNYTAIDYERWAKHGTTARGNFELKTRPGTRDTGIQLQSAQDAYESVLKSAGASHARDAVDARIVAGIRDRTGRMIDSQSEVGGWPVLQSAPPPRCTNGDGIPDDWKTAHGLDINDPDIRNARTLDKNYTNLEVYLNSLVADIIK